MLDGSLSRLYPTARHYILDSKFDGDFDKYPGRVSGDVAPARPGSNDRYQVWQPLALIPEEIEKWLHGIRKDAPAILYIDELVSLVYKRQEYSAEYNIIQKVGRSLPIGTITCTQELSRIPQNAYKQATHRLGFYIDKASEYDRRIRDALLKERVADTDDQYGFYYQHINGRGSPMYFPTVQKFLS